MVNMKVWTQSQDTGTIALSHICGGSLVGPDAVLTGEQASACRRFCSTEDVNKAAMLC